MSHMFSVVRSKLVRNGAEGQLLGNFFLSPEDRTMSEALVPLKDRSRSRSSW